MGGVLGVVGVDGFLGNLEQFYDQADAEGAPWRAFVASWWQLYGDREVGVSDLWALINPAAGDPIDLGLRDGSERSQKTQLGARLVKARDRQYDGLRIVAAGTQQRAKLFRLQSVMHGGTE